MGRPAVVAGVAGNTPTTTQGSVEESLAVVRVDQEGPR